jgi:hypothetical protein
MLRIRNWKQFQHYKNLGGRPRWIKLYHKLMEDKQWHDLSGDAAKGLVMLWLIASEAGGDLPSIPDLAFRMRISENRVIALLSDCSHWIETGPIATLEQLYSDSREPLEQNRIEEKRIEEEKNKISCASKSDARLGSPEFLSFWDSYPRKEGRKAALRIWVKKNLDSQLGEVLAGLEAWNKARKPEFMPYAQGWLNQEAWKEIPLRGGGENKIDNEKLERIRRERQADEESARNYQEPRRNAGRSFQS